MPIISLVIVFALALLLQRWLHRHIQGFTLALTGNPGCGVRMLFYLMLPGVLLHEMSHFLIAKVLFVRVREFNIGLGNLSGQQISLGSVHMDKSDPVRESLIGVAPFVVGITAIALIAGYGFAIWPNAGLSPEEIIYRVTDYLNDWTTWLDLYLIFAVSTAMIPSESDREPWGPILMVIGVAVVILFIMGWTPRLPSDIVALARQLVDALTLSLTIAVAVNAAMALLLWLSEMTLARVGKRRVEYKSRGRSARE